MICKNCENEFEGKFCNACGQTAAIHRITIKEIFHNWIHVLTHADKSIFKLIVNLAKDPGIVAREYIEGKRIKYFSPLQFLVLMTTVTTFLNLTFQIMGSQIPPEVYNTLSDRNKFFYQFNMFSYKYMNIYMFLSVPIAAFSTRIFFADRNYNYAENLIANAYFAGERSVLFIFAVLFIIILPRQYSSIILLLYTLFMFIYLFYAYKKFFLFKNVKDYFKGILSLIFMYILHLIFMFGSFTLLFYKK